jgi:hypothetical protein
VAHIFAWYMLAGHAFVDAMYPSSSGDDAVVIGHQCAPLVDWDLTAIAFCATSMTDS